MGTDQIPADVVLTGGRVLTLDGGHRATQAIAIRDGRIVAVDSSVGIGAFVAPGTKVIELAGRAVIPGFVDPHTHFGMTTFEPVAVDCRIPPLADKFAVVDAITAAASAASPGRWILGLGYSSRQGLTPMELTRDDLDAAAPENPVCVVDLSVHASYANSAAMRLAALSRDTADPDGGHFVRNEAGEPSGPLWERAMDQIYGMSVAGLAEYYGEDVVAQLVRENSMRHLAYGITSVADAAVTPEAAAVYAAADRRGAIPFTLHQMRTGNGFFSSPDPEYQAMLLGVPSSDRLRGGTMKMFMDPVFPRNAGYQFHADGTRERLGRPYYQQEDANLLAAEGARRGLQVAIHCLGTWAIDIAMEAITEAARHSSVGDLRHRLEHFTSPTYEQIGRAAAMDVTVVTQPSFFFQGGERSVERLRDAGVDAPPMALRTMIDEGLTVALSSDFPCGPLAPMLGISSLVSRQTRGSLEPIAGVEAVSAAEAISLYTIAGARAMHREGEVGTIEVGKRADLVVLSHDPTAVDPTFMREIVVEQTFVDGRRLYDLYGREA
ncbi:MAG: amidohydrolase [Dehalococcoidia bacterium]|nr:amidohydrolase [Dehalococcoidia bacterium]